MSRTPYLFLPSRAALAAPAGGGPGCTVRAAQAPASSEDHGLWIHHALATIVRLDALDLFARRARALSAGFAIAAMALLAFFWIGEHYVTPIVLAAILLTATLGPVVTIYTFWLRRTLRLQRHAIVRQLYRCGLRVEQKTIVTNTPHPTLVASLDTLPHGD